MKNKIYRTNWLKMSVRDSKKLWLDKNENTDEILNNYNFNILKKITRNSILAYPDLGPLYKLLSKKLNLNVKHILLTTGADGGIKSVFETFIKKGDATLRLEPTFAMYSIYPKVFKSEDLFVEFEKNKNGINFNLNKFFQLIIKKKPRLICIANPNSPTGTIIKKKDILRVLKLAKKIKSKVLIDEAYFPYYKFSYLRHLSTFDNLIVVRSAKCYGMSGLRVGYLISSEEIVSKINEKRPLYEINNIAAKLFYNSLKNQGEMYKSVKRLQEGKKFFLKHIKRSGFKTLTGFANFIHVDFGENRKRILRGLQNILYCREYESHKSMKNFSRITLTTKKNFKLILSNINRNNK